MDSFAETLHFLVESGLLAGKYGVAVATGFMGRLPSFGHVQKTKKGLYGARKVTKTNISVEGMEIC